VRARIAAAVKRGLLSAGQYRRVLRRSTFPGVAVLCYHGVRPDDMPDGSIAFQYLHIRASEFEGHCRLIRDTCNPISLDDWRAAAAGSRPLPPRPVLITFDDGYRSVFRHAAPMLSAYGLPAAVFVCSGPLADRRLFWFDEIAARDGEAAVERWKAQEYYRWRAACAQTSPVANDDPRAPMTVDEVTALSMIKGIEIGGHTAWHPILARASRDSQREEIAQNLRAVAEWTGGPVRAFAYPNGRRGIDYNSDTMELLRESGIDAAFTTEPSFATADAGALERSRFLILDNVNDAELAHRLAYSWPR
jgi:peptidoglycan/xylan/chitin deacetylase (PgdA/CDA1 family)